MWGARLWASGMAAAIRKKVSGQTRTEVKGKLEELHSELDAGVRTVRGYPAESAVTGWLAEGLPGRAAKTVEVYRDALRPVLAVIGRAGGAAVAGGDPGAGGRAAGGGGGLAAARVHRAVLADGGQVGGGAGD